MTVRAPHRRASWHDAFDAQMALWRWYRSPMGRLFMNDSMRVNAGAVSMKDTQELLAQMHGSERQRLLDTDPIFVSAEMCEVIDAASSLFRPEPLLETDLITPRGFLYFERPFLIADRFDEPTFIAGASWNRLFRGGNSEVVEEVNRRIREWQGSMLDLENLLLEEDPEIEPWGLALTIYTDTRAHIDHLGDNPYGTQVQRLYPGTLPRLVPLHLTPWYFNMTFSGNEWTDIGEPSGAEWWWRIVQSTFRLMQQRIAVKHRQLPERSTRKAARRMGAQRDPEVVVVRLRRERGESSEPSGEEANYSHRFIVGGHWRNAWYASVQEHRQIWISPYIKGPADKPLIVRPRRVYQWDR